MVEKLTYNNNLLNPNEITKNINTKIIGKKVYSFKKIQSTNIYAKQLIEERTEDGTIVVSEIQTGGRGRKNRVWVSPYGGLWFSIILYPTISPKSGMVITMAASISVSQAIKDITGLETEIKWPNDILLKNKKVCGILTEIDADLNKINYAIVGIGINVNNKVDDELSEIAISLKQEIYSNVSKFKLLRSILDNFEKYYIKLKNNDFKYIKKLWLNYSNIIGRNIKITEEKTVTKGVVKDINDNGYLILDTAYGQKRVLNGDVTYL